MSNTELQPNLRCPSVEVLEALNWLSEQGRCTYGSVAEVVHNDRYPVESISVALQKRREKSRLTESPSPIPPPTSSQTRPIVIPTEKKWAAYEELPPGWVIDSDSSSASSSVTSSISFPSTSASLSSESLSAHQSDGYESNRSSMHAAQSDEDLSVSLLVYPLQSDKTFDYQQGFLASDAELEEELREHED